MIRRLLTRDVPGCPRLHLSCVDVRDVAQLHVMAMTKPEAAGQRFVCSGDPPGSSTSRAFCSVISAPAASASPAREVRLARPRRCPLRQIRSTHPERASKPCEFSHDLASRTFGWQPRGIEEIFVATGESLIERGLV